DGKTLTVAAINATADTQTVDLSLSGFTPSSNGQLWRLTGPSLNASNQVGQPPQVTVTEAAFDARETSVPIEPYSVELRTYTGP
ncbi:MAG: alpha-L-arabinofuranosidase, partial [Actinobacteria bacterium]|nr:alpha-L-arabinofuranosidase [Actinomycetota bacterium]